MVTKEEKIKALREYCHYYNYGKCCETCRCHSVCDGPLGNFEFMDNGVLNKCYEVIIKEKKEREQNDDQKKSWNKLLTYRHRQ